MRRKKIVTIILIILMLTSVTVTLISCKGLENQYEVGYFKCINEIDKETNETYVCLLDLTELGKQQEVIAIPEFINGLPVKQLGGIQPTYVYSLPYRMNSENLKKLYILNETTKIFKGLIVPNATVVIMGFSSVSIDDHRLGRAAGWMSNCKAKNIIYDFYIGDQEMKNMFTEETKIANVYYYVNQELKYTDYIEENGLYLYPEDYDAKLKNVIWYMDKDCTKLWNREFRLFSEEEVLNLYCKN